MSYTNSCLGQSEGGGARKRITLWTVGAISWLHLFAVGALAFEFR